MSYEYLLILAGFALVGCFLQNSFKVRLFKNIGDLIKFSVIYMILGVAWDTLAIYRGHWVYTGKGITGIYIGLMPFEDYLFILVVGYFTLVLYKVITKKD